MCVVALCTFYEPTFRTATFAPFPNPMPDIPGTGFRAFWCP